MSMLFGFKARMQGEKKYEARSVPACTMAGGLIKMCGGQLKGYDLFQSSTPNGKRTKMKANDMIAPGIYITAVKKRGKKK